MAKLDRFKRSANAITQGAWKRPDPDIDLKILCRAKTDEFTDFLSARQRRAAKGFGGDFDSMPVAMKRKVNTRALIEKCLIDVDFKDDDGNAVSFEEFCDYILDPDYPDLASAAWVAVDMATADREADLEEAAKN